MLRGHTRLRLLPFLGPAFIAAVAYVDPGNFATNIAGGAKYGYTLLWVIVASNLMATIGIIVVAIGACYVVEIFKANPDWSSVGHHAVVPGFAGADSVLLAVGILGATVMPHVIWLHSALTQNRIRPENDEQAKRLMRL